MTGQSTAKSDCIRECEQGRQLINLGRNSERAERTQISEARHHVERARSQIETRRSENEPRGRLRFTPPFPVAPPRLTSWVKACAFPSQFAGRRVMVTGRFHRCKAPTICDLRLSDCSLDAGELALETYSGVPTSAKKCHLFYDVTLPARLRIAGQNACRPNCNSRVVGARVGFREP
jgi:hypothetical protein